MLAEGQGRERWSSRMVLRLYAFTPVSYMGYADIYMVICINKDKLFASANSHLVRNLVGAGHNDGNRQPGRQ